MKLKLTEFNFFDMFNKYIRPGLFLCKCGMTPELSFYEEYIFGCKFMVSCCQEKYERHLNPLECINGSFEQEVYGKMLLLKEDWNKGKEFKND